MFLTAHEYARGFGSISSIKPNDFGKVRSCNLPWISEFVWSLGGTSAVAVPVAAQIVNRLLAPDTQGDPNRPEKRPRSASLSERPLVCITGVRAESPGGRTLSAGRVGRPWALRRRRARALSKYPNVSLPGRLRGGGVRVGQGCFACLDYCITLLEGALVTVVRVIRAILDNLCPDRFRQRVGGELLFYPLRLKVTLTTLTTLTSSTPLAFLVGRVGLRTPPRLPLHRLPVAPTAHRAQPRRLRFV